jgi:flagellar motor protein MotB
MGGGIATLSINLEARLADLQAGFDKAARLAEKNASDVEARYNRLASVAVSVGTALASVLPITLLAQFFRTTVNGLDALNDLADATGASIENLSALEDIAARTGTAFDTVGSALVRFNAELSNAKEGSQTAEILRRIGLSAEELRRLDPAEALRRTAVALAQFADDGDKARAVQALFGRSVGEVAPLLKDLAEAGQLNATVTAEQAQEAERFNRQLADFTKNLTDAGRAITGDLLGPLNQLLEGFNALARLRLLNFSSVVEVLKGNTFADPAEGAAFYSKELENLQRQFQIIATTTTGAARRGALIDLSNDIEQITRLRDFYRQFAQKELPQASYSNEGRNSRRVFGDLPEVPAGPRRTPRPGAQKAADFDFGDPVLRSAQGLVDATDTQRLGDLQLKLQGLFELGGSNPSPAIVEAMQKLGLAINDLTPGQRELRARQSRLDELIGGTPSGQRQKVLDDIELINEAYSGGAISVEAWAEAQVANTARLPKELQAQLKEMDAFTRQFQANVQNVLGDNIASALQGDFDSIEEAWKTMLLNMVAQATAADLTKRLFGADGRGGWASDLSKWFGGFFADGAVFSKGQPITAFADGGVLTRPTFFGMGGGRMGVAGEAGAEGILPLRRGPNGRLGVEAYGGGGMTVVNHVAAGVTRGEVTTAIQLAMQATESSVLAKLRAARVL